MAEVLCTIDDEGAPNDAVRTLTKGAIVEATAGVEVNEVLCTTDGGGKEVVTGAIDGAVALSTGCCVDAGAVAVVVAVGAATAPLSFFGTAKVVITSLS